MLEHVRGLDTVRVAPHNNYHILTSTLHPIIILWKGSSLLRYFLLLSTLITHIGWSKDRNEINVIWLHTAEVHIATFSLGRHERSYHVNCTRSRPIPEVKLRRVQPVVRCLSTCEAWILFVLLHITTVTFSPLRFILSLFYEKAPAFYDIFSCFLL